MPQVNCPTLMNYLAQDECLENLAGLGEVVYIGLRGDLAAPLSATDNLYAAPTFKDGKGLFKFDLKEEAQKIAGESQGKRKGYNITGTMVFDGVDAKVSKILRALNNLDWFAIFPDPSGDAQILYDANKKVRIDQGGATTDTGAAASDDRISTVNFILGPVKYPNLFVTAPQDGWDSLLGFPLEDITGYALGFEGEVTIPQFPNSGSILLLSYDDIEADYALKKYRLGVYPETQTNWDSLYATIGDAYVSQKDNHIYLATATGWEDKGLFGG